MVAEGSCLILWTVYFAWIGRDAFYFVYMTVGMNVLGVIGGLFVVESPRYLFGMENFDKCRESLLTIAKWNGV